MTTGVGNSGYGTVNNAAGAGVSQEIKVLDNLADFARAVQEAGVTLDFAPLVSLNVNFMDSASDYLILSLKGFDSKSPDNLIFINKQSAILYSNNPPTQKAVQSYQNVLSRPYGAGTVLSFLVLKNVLTSFRTKLETLISQMGDLETRFDSAKYRELTLDFARLYDRAEDLHEMLIEFEEPNIKEIGTRLISFDYRVLLAESDNLVNRCRNRFNIFKEFARDHELRETALLNQRIEHLNDVVKRLTAITLILMIPTLIATHFGMNFVNMPELKVAWAYPAIIVIQIVLLVGAIVLFRKTRWL